MTYRDDKTTKSPFSRHDALVRGRRERARAMQELWRLAIGAIR